MTGGVTTHGGRSQWLPPAELGVTGGVTTQGGRLYRLDGQQPLDDVDEETEAQNIRDIKEQEVYFGELPIMTDSGTFIKIYFVRTPTCDHN